jgi:hypothetical protein
MATLKAIETIYKDYRFRSRLEARWAVYFDSLGVEWEYEKEGFDLGGVWYLPDFWLKTVNMWAEVKPGAFHGEEIEKCKLLVRQSGYGCLLLDGMPEDRPYIGYDLWEDGDGDLQMWDDGYVVDERTYLLDDIYIHDEHRFYIDPFGGETLGLRGQEAVRAAKRARFEHGEKP